VSERQLRIVVADDEPLARQRVRSMLAGRPGCEVVGEATNGAEAVALIVRERPDVVFLDIKMPELDGFEVIAALEATAGAVPAVVFVTAFGDYAVKAFDVRALDYLLKPFDRARFDRALESALARSRERSEGGAGAGFAAGVPPELREALSALGERRRYPARFLVRSGSRMYFVRADEIEWADAAGNYVRLHAGGRTHLVRQTMTAFESQLDPDRFVRVHRSALVNVDRIAQIEPYVHGEYVITMRDGTRLTSSRAHGGRLRALLDRSG
jgi:two-component system LytT family response regulator